MSDSIADAVGVNTHINYTGSIYFSGYESIIRPRLLESGIRHIRDNVSTDARVIARYGELADKGIRLLLINYRADARGIDYIKQLNARASRPVEMVEPPNEMDCNDATWETLLRDFQTAFWKLMRADPETREIPFLGPSLCNSRACQGKLAASAPGMNLYMDAGNIHDYSGDAPELELGGGWGLSPEKMLERYRLLSGTKPIISTENGYKMSGATTGHPFVSQRAAAKYLPRMFLDRFGRGVLRTYIYQLINDREDFGLLNGDGSPRAQFLAVKNLVQLFSDKGATFSPGSLDVQLTGDTSKVKSMLFQKRSGVYFLVLWQAVKSYDPAAAKDLEPATKRVAVRLGTRFKSIRTHLPSLSTTTTGIPAPADGLDNFTLNVPDHILVVELGDQVGGLGMGIKTPGHFLRAEGFKFDLIPSGFVLDRSRSGKFRIEVRSFEGRLLGTLAGEKAGRYFLGGKGLGTGIYLVKGFLEDKPFITSLLIGR